MAEGLHGQPDLGLISKTLDPQDHRCCRLSLSDKGQRLVKNVMERLS